MRDTYIPIFNNRVNDYREWRQRILLYKRKLALQGKEKEATLNLLTSLHGVAWKQVEHLVESVVESSDGFDKVLVTLDAAFKYDSRVEMPRALEKFFYQLTRRGDQTLLQYCSEHREQLREIEKFGIKMPDSVSGWMLLRRSQLTLEQRQLVQSQVGAEMKTAKIEEAMYYLFGQDYRSRVDQSTKWQKSPKGKGQRWYPRKSQQGYAAEDYDPEYEEEPEDGFALLEEEPYEEEPNYDETEEYEAIDDELYYQDDGWADEPDPQLEEAYATRWAVGADLARGFGQGMGLSIGSDDRSGGGRLAARWAQSVRLRAHDLCDRQAPGRCSRGGEDLGGPAATTRRRQSTRPGPLFGGWSETSALH
eukprot:g30233.t1